MVIFKIFIITALQEGGEREKRREEGMNKEKKRIREHSREISFSLFAMKAFF